MAMLSKKLRSIEGGGLSFRCPGCKQPHIIWTSDGHSGRWGWNGDVERPTFTPSILVRTIRGEGLTEADWEEYDRIASGPDGTEAVLNHPKFRWVCHSFVTNGLIQFLGDSTHELAGQTVELADWPEDWE